ncbi:hypothetical protein OJ998_01620 [Solirubrobacter taibaiensis]|nr:hypothetical protein [Solirubrobacter taibaiensis]
MTSRVFVGSLLAGVLVPSATALASSIVPLSAPLSIGMSPVSPRAGSEVRLTGGLGAPSYAWDLDGDGEFDDATGKDVTTTFATGTRTVRARAVTAVGVVTDSRTFTVRDFNVAPGGTVSVKPYSARVGVPVTVTAKGADPDGLSVKTALDLDGDGTFETDGATSPATFATPGERVIRARFTDDAGATSVATTTLDVHAGNIAPTVRFPEPYATVAGDYGDSGRLLNAVDPDGEIVRYEYDLNDDGTYETDRGNDARVPTWPGHGGIVRARVTDDSGATAVVRASPYQITLSVPRVTQVGTATTLSVPKWSWIADVSWDADGDGAFDDGTGNEIAFTYPTAGTYEVRARGTNVGPGDVVRMTVSVREPADIAVPTVAWTGIPPVRAAMPSVVTWAASGPSTFDSNVDLDGDGVFNDVPKGAGGFPWTFGGPQTVAVRATDTRGRTAVATTAVPFVAGDLGPDVTMATFDIAAPLKAEYRRVELFGSGTDADDGVSPQIAWDADNDGAFDDGAYPGGSHEDTRVTASLAARATDQAGVSTTVRREITPIVPQVAPRPEPRPVRWLDVSARRPGMATLLRRGMTVDVRCTKPKCRTRLVVKVDLKTARKLGLRSRTVADRSVSGTRRVAVRLTPRARRAFARVRSGKLILTATATADGGAKSALTKTMTVRKIADRS